MSTVKAKKSTRKTASEKKNYNRSPRQSTNSKSMISTSPSPRMNMKDTELI